MQELLIPTTQRGRTNEVGPVTRKAAA